jgi:hypothetical protein
MNKTMTNPNCDGGGPCRPGQVRKLPLGGGANTILCRSCFDREIAYRKECNKQIAPELRFGLPKFEDLEVYNPE